MIDVVAAKLILRATKLSMSFRRFFLVLSFSGFFLYEAAYACSVGKDFVRPSNFELVELADIIAVVTPTSQRRIGNNDRQVNFRVEKVLKGDIDPTFENVGWVRLGNVEPSDPDDISSAHPEAYGGPCNRVTFKKSRQYAFFLSYDDDGGLSLLGYPFSRVSEDYYGGESLWGRTIQYYLEVQALDDRMQELEVLKEKYEMLTATEMELRDNKLAADIADHLTSRSPYKPTEYLLQSYRALDEERELPFVVRSPVADKEGSQSERVAELVFGNADDPNFDTDEQKQFILWSLVNGEHPTAMPLFERLSREKKLSASVLGAVLRFLSKHGRYHDAIDLARHHAFRIVNNETEAEVSEFLRGIFSLAGRRGFDDKAMWEEDEYARDWWPEFAIALNTNLRARFGRGATYTLSRESEYLRPDDYRDRPDVALELVRSYDDDVVEWAKQEYLRLRNSNEKAYESSYGLPIGILLEDYRPDNGEFLQSLVCSSSDDRYIALKYLGLHHTTYTDDLAAQVAVLDLNDEHKETLIQSLAMFAANERKEYITGQGWGGDDPLELITALTKGEKINLSEYRTNPLKCQSKKIEGLE